MSLHPPQPDVQRAGRICGPILLLAGNRQATKDRAIAQRDDEELGVIYRLQHEQMEILSLVKDAQAKHTEILEMLRQPR